HGHKLTCAVLDIDHFKLVNDTYGHAVGDTVLTAVVQACKNALRGSDVVGRIGGEEFGILLPHTDLARGMAALEKVRAAVAALQIEVPDGKIRVKCSLGGAEFSPGQPFDETLRCADL